MNLASYLKTIPDFSAISSRDLEVLEKSMLVNNYPDGHIFFHEGKIFRAQPVDRSRTDLLGELGIATFLPTSDQLDLRSKVHLMELGRRGDALPRRRESPRPGARPARRRRGG